MKPALVTTPSWSSVVDSPSAARSAPFAVDRALRMLNGGRPEACQELRAAAIAGLQALVRRDPAAAWTLTLDLVARLPRPNFACPATASCPRCRLGWCHPGRSRAWLVSLYPRTANDDQAQARPLPRVVRGLLPAWAGQWFPDRRRFAVELLPSLRVALHPRPDQLELATPETMDVLDTLFFGEAEACDLDGRGAAPTWSQTFLADQARRLDLDRTCACIRHCRCARDAERGVLRLIDEVVAPFALRTIGC